MPGVCPRCHRDVYFAEEKLALGKVWHAFCFTCRNCQKLLDSCTVTTHCNELFCKTCYNRLRPSNGKICQTPETTNGSGRIASNPEPFGDCCCRACASTNFPIVENYAKNKRLRGGGIEVSREKSDEIDQTDIPCSEVECSDAVSITTSTCNHPTTPNLHSTAHKPGIYSHRAGATYPPLPPSYKATQPLRKSFCDHGTNIPNPYRLPTMQNVDNAIKDRIHSNPTGRYELWRADSPNNDRTSDCCIPVFGCDGQSASCFQRNTEVFADDSDINDRRMRGGCGGCGGNSCSEAESYFSDKRAETCCGNQYETNVESVKNCAGSRGSTRESRCRGCDFTSSNPCAGKVACCSSVGRRPCCKKTARCPSPCTAGDSQNCGGGGCCGSGCRGGCGRPGQLCLPARPCTMPPCMPHAPSSGSPCAPPRSSAPQPPCCRTPRGTNCGAAERNDRGRICASYGGSRTGSSACCRSQSPRVRRRGCCIDDCCQSRPPSGCECLGGGLDCQRCGRKVYQAEMQIASGVPYHNICFSCFCCRKPLEPLTYQENCGEIYCKQCYVRNFGPQGYGYGIGPGVLQTPM